MPRSLPRAIRIRIPLLLLGISVVMSAFVFALAGPVFQSAFAGRPAAARSALVAALELALAPSAAAFAFIALVALLLDRWLRGPAERLEDTARRLAAGDWSARSGLRGDNELERVGRAMDAMADQMQHAHAELLASRHRLEEVLRALPAAFILTDRASGNVLFVSARWHESSLGRFSIGDNFREHVEREHFFHLDGTPIPREQLATMRALATGRPESLESFLAVHANGPREHHSAWATPLTLNGGPEFDAVLTVVQERDEVLALTGRLREWEERFRKVAESTGQVVYEWDFESGAVRRTGNQLAVLGFTAEQELAVDALAHWESRVHPDDRERTREAFLRHRAEGSPFDLEYRYRRDERRWIRVHDRGFFERDEAGRVVRMIGSMSDVTAHRDTEAQLRQAQKMETVGTLAGGIAHDFNNQLTAVLGHLDMLANELPPGDPRGEHVRTATSAAERCAELTRGLLAFSRRLHGSPSAASLNTTVLESARLLRRVLPAHIRLETALAESLPAARFDGTQIQQVLFNLCINSRDAMPHGGTLRIGTEVRTLSADALPHRDAKPGRWVVLRVRDDGTGIPADVLPRVFEPFFTTKPVGAGTGLGLAMVYGIVSEHGGWVEADSAEGRGSEFSVWLPACEEPVAAAAAGAAPARDAVSGLGGGELVLIVDDEAILRELVGRALREQGFRVLEAGDAPGGLELASAHAGELRGVLLDMTMPGMSGAEALPLLRSVAPGAAVVLTSGYSVDSGRALEGAAGFLPKPWSLAELAVTLRRAMDTRA